MEDRKRSDKLLVVTDEAGNVMSATWPGVQSEGAPTETGVRLSAGQSSHEVDVPDELYQLARPDLSGFRVQVDERGAALIRRPNDKGAYEA